jgi:maltooligosyltrehalose trehalohydrolase
MPINLDEVGAFPSVDAAGNLSLRVGVYLPGIRQTDGFQVVVRIIHKSDRFDPAIQPVDLNLEWQAASALGLWTGTTELTPDPASHYGQDGTYLYRFQLLWISAAGQSTLITRWFTDPFARATDVGMLAAVQCTHVPAAQFAWTDNGWSTPELDDLVVYELHVEQFNNTFQGIVDMLPFLQSLGVNCLELMPVTSTNLDFDWGYGPLQYFAPNAEYGGPDELRQAVDACHAAGVAVIFDLVYQHVDPSFPYNQVYADVAAANIPGIGSSIASPMIGSIGQFGPQVSFSLVFAQQFFWAANQQWLDQYHVDGFRYDEVTDLYQGPTDTGYALLVYETYLYSRSISRFGCGPNTYSRIVQCAEALQIAPTVLRSTYTNAAWQDGLLNLAESAIGGALDVGTLTAFAHALDPYFGGLYPATKTVVDSAGNPVEMPVAPFQYVNSHDHSHLICFAGTTGAGPIPSGDRTLFYRLQPFAIALYTSQGVPMLWEGEEFGDNYVLPPAGSARINLRRDVNWEYFYDDEGVPLIRLFRILGKLRSSSQALRSRESYFYYQQSLQGTAVVAYHRHAPATATTAEQYAMVLLNFNPSAGTITLPFPKAGIWTEMINADVSPTSLNVAADGSLQTVTVPSWYGYVYLCNL